MTSMNSILQTEERNTRYVYLHREGIFLKGYQHSAYLFLKHCNVDYEVKCHYVKSVSSLVYSIGFPQTAISKHFSEEEIERTDDNNTLRINVEEIDSADYEQWKQQFVAEEKKRASQSTIAGGNGGVIERIRSFNVSASTPMECMMLVAELQKKLV